MKKSITKTEKKGKLSAALVDEFSGYVGEKLSETKLSAKDALRFRLSPDTAMCTWLRKIGEGAPCRLTLSRHFGRVTITVACEGKKCNPQEQDDAMTALEGSSLLQSIGLSVGYSYEDGENRLRLMPPSGFVLRLLPLLLSCLLGLGLAAALKALLPDGAVSLNTQVVEPVFSTLMSILLAIAGPMIFLAVLSGIYNIGDLTSLSTVGKS